MPATGGWSCFSLGSAWFPFNITVVAVIWLTYSCVQQKTVKQIKFNM